ncbi:MAG: haloacid dehalogenase [Rhodobiaceae bacterium]|nr:MAG: haloacid dehalogenase [Rhodobiaceae bacterium]
MSGRKLVVFDCDGTLVDSQHMIVAAMDRAFDVHSLPKLPRAQVLSIVGLSLQEAITALLPEENAATITLVQESYRQAFFHLREDPSLHEPLFPGAREALTALAERDDILLGVATGKSRRGLRSILELHDLKGMFATLQTADDHPSKPHPAMLLQAMTETGVAAGDTVIIGDTSFDMVMGVEAGVRPIGVSWGYHKSYELTEHGAVHVLEQFDELIPFLAAEWTGVPS